MNIERAKATYATGSEDGLLSLNRGHIGTISKMGGRMVYYYADDLTNMLVEDLLLDTVKEL